MQLDIILRTHDVGSVHGRDVDWPKKEIVHRCVNSVFNAVDGLDNVKTVIVDDHSSNETLQFLSRQRAFLEPLEGTGNNASLQKVFELAADSKADVVYVVEDDYLHYPEAISEAMGTFEYFQKMMGREDICLSLVDCPLNYAPPRDGLNAQIVGGTKRAWRTNNHTGGTFMTTPEVINKYWGAFDTLAKHWPNENENTTWNKIWANQVPLFTPMIPLAYHLSIHHPFHPWDKLWRQSKCTHKLSTAA